MWSEDEIEPMLRSLGVDEDLLPNCTIALYLDGDDPPTLAGLRASIGVGPEDPPLTHEQLQRAAATGLILSLNFWDIAFDFVDDELVERKLDISEPFDLRSLGDLLAEFRGIELNGSAARFTGFDALKGAVSLETLRMEDDLPVAVDLSRLPKLADARLSGHNALSVAQNPALRELQLEATRVPADFGIFGTLESLSLQLKPAPTSLAVLHHPESLEFFSLRGAAVFDVRSLLRAPLLERIFFYGCRRLENVDALTGLPMLREVDIHGAYEATGAAALLDWEVERLTVESNYAFGPELIARAEERPGRWFIAPQKPPRAAKRSARLTFVDGLDLCTFAPFEVAAPDAAVGRNDYRLTFTEFRELEERLHAAGVTQVTSSGHGMDDLLQAAVAERMPAALASGRVEFDSEGDEMIVWITSKADVTQVGKIALALWEDPAWLKRLAGEVGGGTSPQ